MVYVTRKFVFASASLLYGAVVLGNGFDRLSPSVPSLQRLVFRPFRSSASVTEASTAFARDNFSAAEQYAAQGVAASPMNRFAVSMIATARLSAGQQAAAYEAFRVSGNLGWRDVPTQLFWYETGIQSGDFPLAAQRADAVLRTYPRYPQARALLTPLEVSPDGQAALLARMVERPNWLTEYATPGSGMAPAELQRRAVMLNQLARSGVSIGCTSVRKLAFELVDNGLRTEAVNVWKEHCNKATGSGLLFDTRFQALNSNSQSPFEWRTFATGDVIVRSAAQLGGGAEVANSSIFTSPVLAQMLNVGAGLYRVKLDVSAQPGAVTDAANKIFATVTCKNELRRGSYPQDSITGAGQVLEVKSCAEQVLTIWLRPDTGLMTLKHITVESLGRSR